MTMLASSVRLASALSPGRILAKNIWGHMGEYTTGLISDLQSFKNNAFILSSLIQVSSRIFVANRTARRTQDTPEGPFRYMESVKTTFREAGGWVMSYAVLRTFQRWITDGMCSALMIKRGFPYRPTWVGWSMKKMGWVPQNFVADPMVHTQPPFPSMWGTAKSLGRDINNYFQGKGRLDDFAGRSFKRFASLLDEKVRITQLEVDPRGQRRVAWVAKNLRSTLGRVFKSVKSMGTAKLLLETCEVAPLLIGSIPALLLSGFLLERFSQNHAETVAQKIAGFLGKHATPGEGSARPASSLAHQARPVVDPRHAMAYAGRAWTPQTNAGAVFRGTPLYPARY